MSTLVKTSTGIQRLDGALGILADPEASLEDRTAAFAILQQVKLRLHRALKASSDDIIIGMERAGLRDLGPVSIKSSAVDPRYVVNEPDNWGDDSVQDALAELRADSRTRPYVRVVPAHLEIDPLALAADVQLGVQAALTLYSELNKRRWRVEVARRLSLAVREVTPSKAGAA